MNKRRNERLVGISSHVRTRHEQAVVGRCRKTGRRRRSLATWYRSEWISTLVNKRQAAAAERGGVRLFYVFLAWAHSWLSVTFWNGMRQSVVEAAVASDCGSVSAIATTALMISLPWNCIRCNSCVFRFWLQLTEELAHACGPMHNALDKTK